MVLVFWQGMISIHQKALLEALTKQPSVTKVLLVVEHDITPYRKNMGWEVPEVKGVEIICAPSKDAIRELVGMHKDAIHIMGGIKVGEMLSAAFDECARLRCRMGIMTEPYNAANIKGWLRMAKYHYYRLRYAKHIQFILAIGKKGVNQFVDIGFRPEIVFPWAYFISLDVSVNSADKQLISNKIIYAGRIEEGKGIFDFTNELIRTNNRNFRLDIYGSGPDEEKIRKLIADNNVPDRINIYPFLPHDELIKKYPEYDWVVLPSSQKDGWGVIISEGLLAGLKAICSSICGASWVITDGFNGLVFDWAEQDSCKRAIHRMLTDDSFADAKTISTHAKSTISGEAGATYFVKIMNCVYEHKERPGIPWL